jgi:hypothetical protein
VQFRDVSTSDHPPFPQTFEAAHFVMEVSLWTLILWKSQVFIRELSKTDQFLTLQMLSYQNSCILASCCSCYYNLFLVLYTIHYCNNVKI